MHGAGNDYVFIDGFETPLPRNPSLTAKLISDRHRGIGSDGLICLVPPSGQNADVEMRMWNADGSVGLMCGNGVRCVALLMSLRGRIKSICRVATSSRIVDVEMENVDHHNKHGFMSVNMGQPEFSSEFAETEETIPVITNPAWASQKIQFTEVSMGNPHAVIFGLNLSDENVCGLGRLIETHERFPDGVNVEWVEVVSPTQFNVRVWERGSGETMACGSGACAVAVAAVLRGISPRGERLQIRLPGGELNACWQTSGDVTLRGTATLAFTGIWHGRSELHS